MASLFGFEITRSKDDKEFPSFVERSDDEGAALIAPVTGSSYGTYVDIEGSTKNDAELITKYRELSREAEIEYAIDEIVNEAIASDENDVVTINTDNIEGYSDSIKKMIRDEFDHIKELFNINNISYEIFRRWYIDGRMYYHMMIDPANPGKGIQELRYIDPRKIRKVMEITKKVEGNQDVTLKYVKNEYFLFSEKGFGMKANTNAIGDNNNYSTKSLKIAKDSVIFTSSGLMDENNKTILSYLHKAIRPVNQLRSLESSVVIYRIARAPERRIFYIDVGNLPKAKAEQYLRDMMVKHKNRLVYDSNTGEVRDDRKHMTMLEDFWFPRREGGRGTEITTLSGGQNLGEMADVEYFQQKLYKALNIPTSRLEQGTGFQIGRPSEISRDEIKFQKFINRLRKRFSQVFYQALEKQLILKKIISEDEWNSIKNNIYFEFAVDNHFTEMKNLDIMMSRVEVADRYREYIGTAISSDYMRKKIFGQSEDDIEVIDKEIKAGQDAPSSGGDDFGGGGNFGDDDSSSEPDLPSLKPPAKDVPEVAPPKDDKPKVKAKPKATDKPKA